MALDLHIFGGGPMVAVAARLALRLGLSTSFRTSSRLFSEEAPWVQDLRNLGVPIFVADKLRDAMEAGPPRRQGDFGLSFGAPWIFQGSWIAEWEGLLFNLHCRALPRHRGGGGASWLIMVQDRRGMALIHEVAPGVDDGPIVATLPFVYPEGVRLPADYDREDFEQSRALLERWLPEAVSGRIERWAQDERDATYWPRLSTDLHGWIDWSWSAGEIAAFCRAFGAPYGGAKTYLRSRIIAVTDAEVVGGEYFHPFQSGLIFRKHQGRVYVAARGGALRMTIEGPARPGDRFVTPRERLDEALATRVFYMPDGTLRTESMLPRDGSAR